MVQSEGVAQTTSEHAITPVRGSARQLDGTPADLLNPADYPVEAICLECGQPVRCAQYFHLGTACPDWIHIEQFTMTGL